MRFIDDVNHQKGNQSKMNSKKIISLLASAAIVVSSISGLSVSDVAFATTSTALQRPTNDAGTVLTQIAATTTTFKKENFRAMAASDTTTWLAAAETGAAPTASNSSIYVDWGYYDNANADAATAGRATMTGVAAYANVGFYAGMGKTKALQSLAAAQNAAFEVNGVTLNSLGAAREFTLTFDRVKSKFAYTTGYLFLGRDTDDDNSWYIPITVAFPDAVLVQDNSGTPNVMYRNAAGALKTNSQGYNSLYQWGDSDDNTGVAAQRQAGYAAAAAIANTWTTPSYKTRNETIVPYGGSVELFVNKVITDALPNDEFVWTVSDKANFGFVGSTDGTAKGTSVKLTSPEGATKGAKTTLTLYANKVSDATKIFSYEVGNSQPNYFENMYIRDTKNVNGMGDDYAGKTYTTTETKAELHVTATAYINERLVEVPANGVNWTWEKIDGDKDNKIKLTPSGRGSNIATFEVDAIPDAGLTAKYRVSGTANRATLFEGSDNNAQDWLYGSREVTVAFTKNVTPEPTPEPEPEPAVEDGKSYVADNGTTVVTVASAADKIVTLTGMAVVTSDVVIPSSVEIDGTKYTVVAIDKQAFKGMNIKSVTIPATVSSIGKGAFKKCKKLKTVNLEGAAGSVESQKNAFKKTSSKLTVNNSAALTSSGKKQVQKDNGSVSFK